MNDVVNDYYFWILRKIGSGSQGRSFSNLLQYLFTREFYPIIFRDSNRFSDGVDLRYHYAYEIGASYEMINGIFNQSHCSMLEMMAALAIRTEIDTMSNAKYGDRTCIWFWDMVKSLGMYQYDDTNFTARSIYELNEIVDRFMNRTYLANGEGGLVTSRDPNIDMRVLDIWDQMTVYMNEYLELNPD